MEIYTLDKEFIAQETIENTESVIWTERFGAAGDVKFTVEDTWANRLKYAPPTFVASTESDEVMIVDTQSSKEGLLTVSGESLTKFLENRVFRISGYWNATSADVAIYKPGYLMSFIVQQMCMAGSPFTASEFPLWGINGFRQRIHNLYLGQQYEGGVPTAINIPYGPIYSLLKSLSDTYHIGFRLRLESASEAGYVLRFDTYGGYDHTSSNPDPTQLVQFSPTTDTLTGPEMLYSIAGYKNVCNAYATNWVTPAYAYGMGEAFAPGVSSNITDFERRQMIVMVSDIQIPEGYPQEDALGRPPGDPPPGYVLEALHSRARDALANNNYTKLMDGEIVEQGAYQYGVDYNLGDYIELGSGEEFPAEKVQVTEYIRTKDKDGERAYPTVSVIDYL